MTDTTQMQRVKAILRNTQFETENEINCEYICIICKRLLIAPHSSPCGCTYCLECIQKFLTDSNMFCPGQTEECLSSMINFERDVKFDQRMNMKIMKLQVKCPLKSCQYRGLLKTIPDHLESADHDISYEKCPFCDIGCAEEQVVKGEMADHLNTELFTHSSLVVQSINNINNEVATLSTNGEKLKWDMDQQRNNIMEYIEDVSDDCNEKFLDKDREINDLRLQVDQMTVTLHRLEQQIQINQEENRALRNGQNECHRQIMGIIEREKRRVETEEIKEICGEFIWKSSEWNEFMLKWAYNFDHMFMFSDAFDTDDGYRMCLKLECGYSMVSVFLCLMAGPMDLILSWPLTHELIVSFVDEARDTVYQRKSLKYNLNESHFRMRPETGQPKMLQDHLRISLSDQTFLKLCQQIQCSIKCTIIKCL